MVFTVNTSESTERPARPRRRTPAADDRRILYEIIRTVASSVDLDHVLAAIVRLVTEGTQAHAAYVFIVEHGGSRLVLRAASEPYNQAVGKVSMRRGEGLAGWVAEHRRPAFIPDNALADPRIKYFPELDEEKYQSIVSVPLIGKDDEVMGVIALHAEAPRVFSEDDAAFLIHSASLVAGAIENARLYAAARRRVRELEWLSALSETISAAELAGRAAAGRRDQSLALLRAAASTSISRSRRPAAAARPRHRPPPTRRRPRPRRAVERARRGGRVDGTGGALAAALSGGPRALGHDPVPLSADGELIGFLVARGAGGRTFDEDDRDLATSIARRPPSGSGRSADRGAEERNH